METQEEKSKRWADAWAYFGDSPQHPVRLKECGDGIHPADNLCQNCFPFPNRKSD